MDKCRATLVKVRQFLGQGCQPCLVWVALVAILLAVPILGQAEDDEVVATVGPVTGAQTMWSIANENRPDTRASIPQFMLAIVDRNPDAFIAGNVNLLREGATLEIPTVDEALAIPRDEAQRRLDEQMEWFAELSREDRVALRETAEAEPPPVIEEPEPVVEPEEVAPEPDPVLETEEEIVEPEAVPEPEPAPVEADPAPEPFEVVPEPEPDRETEVAIDDDVPEPDPIGDPIEEPEPTEPEILPEAPEALPDPMFEPDAEPLTERPVEDAPEETVDDPAPPVAEVESPPTTAPPVEPGPGPEPGPVELVSWWMWAAAALILLLMLLLILRVSSRRREAAMLESDLAADNPSRSAAGGSAAAAAIPAGRDEFDKEEAAEDESRDDRDSSDVDEDSPWAQFEDSVMGSKPDVEDRTAVLDEPHPAEQSGDRKVGASDDSPAPSGESGAVDEPEDLDLAELGGDQPDLKTDSGDKDEGEFNWLDLDDEQEPVDSARAQGSDSVSPEQFESHEREPSVEDDRQGEDEEPLADLDLDEDFDLADFPRRTPDSDNVVDAMDQPEAPDEDPDEDPEFDLTNFDFDDTNVEGEDDDRTVVHDESPVDDDIDDAVPERSGQGLDDIDEIMARDLHATGLLDGDEDDKRTEIAPPPEAETDSPSDEPPVADQQPEPDETSDDQPRLNDQEAEVMIDLARLTADGGDEQYARDLLAEVIRDGSEKMAQEARKLQASLR